MRRPIKENKPEQSRTPAYVKVTSVILIVSTIFTMAAYRQRQKTYEQLETLVENFCESVDVYCESVDIYCESSDRVIKSNEQLQQSIDSMIKFIH